MKLKLIQNKQLGFRSLEVVMPILTGSLYGLAATGCYDPIQQSNM